jgi:excisionase family DNA binding protein
MSLDDRVQAASQRNVAKLDRLLQQIVTLRAQRKAQALPPEEADLLERINQGVPDDLHAAYQALRAKREAETLTEAEHDRLIQLSNQIEQLGAQRLEALATLAQLRQVALPTLMGTLGLEIQADLTTQEAAELLNVSHSYLINQIEAGEVPHHNVGHHYQIGFADLMAYKRRVDAKSAQALDEMVALSEEMGLYD